MLRNIQKKQRGGARNDYWMNSITNETSVDLLASIGDTEPVSYLFLRRWHWQMLKKLRWGACDQTWKFDVDVDVDVDDDDVDDDDDDDDDDG